jgi:AcrR family transcriptional regulator
LSPGDKDGIVEDMLGDSADGPRDGDDRAGASREQVLGAAVQCLIEVGYASTSTVLVQERADVSRGRLLHHFPTKEKLLVDAARHLVEMRLVALDAVATQSAELGDGPERIDVAVELMWQNFTEDHFDASLELWTAARTNPTLRKTLLPRERENRRLQNRVAAALFGPYADHPDYPELRDLLLTSMRGVAVLRGLGGDRGAREDLALWKATARRTLDPGGAPARDHGGADGWELDEETWSSIEPLLPGPDGRRGGRWSSHRRIVEAIRWKESTGAAWRELPEQFGPWKTVWKRYRRWEGDGTLAAIRERLDDRETLSEA